ncbi:MAG: ATP-dependent RNA helicase DbpA [Mariprofundus sp.]|nr:ATP-dependent RNA helicase DbpA [Mariprofundus sp.]
MNSTSFSNLSLHPNLLRNLASLGYQEMTPIQAQGLPDILAGKDVIGQAKTGSGKTAAFALGLLNKLDATALQKQQASIQTLVLCPTRELADQVSKESRRLARQLPNVKVLTLCGGMPFGAQLASLEHGAHIIVGTPGRIEDHVNRASLSLEHVQTLVLDEADRMLDMGFQASVDAIVAVIPKERQTLLFSATFADKMKAVAKRVMRNPVMVKVESMHDSSTITQHFYQLGNSDDSMAALRLLLLKYAPESAVVFCNTKRETSDVANTLNQYGFSALALNGDMEQWERDQTMIRFANKSISVLVATDVAARGLDMDALDAVINMQLPHEPETYVHRIGRTGRAGRRGDAFTLHGGNAYQLTMLADYLEHSIDHEVLPSEALLKKQPKKALMATLQIGGGKKNKLRPGDIVGALTAGQGIVGNQVGKIHILDHWAYVAVPRNMVKLAMQKLGAGKLKGRSFRIRLIGNKWKT